MRFLADLGTLAAADDSCSRQQFISGVLRELSVAVDSWNARIVAASFALATGRAGMPREARPTASLVAKGR
jgi:hypothetical protein